MQKPSDTCWLSRERAVRAVRRSLPALVNTFEEIYNDTGDAEAHGIATLLTKYTTVACIYMLSDVLHTVAKLQGSLHGKDIDLASVPAMVESTTKRLKELKESPKSSTWFKDHCLVFSDPTQLGTKEIEVTDVMKADFEQNVYRPYLQSVIDHINGRMESTDVISSMSVFDPRQLPSTEKELTDSDYGMEKIKILLSLYGGAQKITFDGKEGFSTPDVDPEETESEWKLFRRVIFVRHRGSTLQQVLSVLLGTTDIVAAFPNLSKLASILMILPVTTATVERTFSTMKLVKTRLRSRMGEDTLEHTMRICIEGPDNLPEDTLDAVIHHYKSSKKRRLPL